MKAVAVDTAVDPMKAGAAQLPCLNGPSLNATPEFKRYNRDRMNIDDRIQALTESVELLATFHRDTEAAIQKLTDQVGQLTGHMNTIAQLVIGHEQRIQNLESGK